MPKISIEKNLFGLYGDWREDTIMKKSLLLLALLCLFSPVAAHAEQFGLYLTPKLVYGVQKFDMKESVTNGSMNLGSHSEDVFGAALAVGYDFGLYSSIPVRAELEIGRASL